MLEFSHWLCRPLKRLVGPLGGLCTGEEIEEVGNVLVAGVEEEVVKGEGDEGLEEEED